MNALTEIVFDAVSEGEFFALIAEGAAILRRLDENSPTFWPDFRRCVEILNLIGDAPPSSLSEAERQLMEVERCYADVLKAHDETGAPLPAPNGQPSKLNRRQWLQVRTPMFKEWFGDWEIAKKSDILNGQPLASLKTEDAPLGKYKDIEEWAAAVFAKQGGVASRIGIGDVTLDSQSAKRSLAHGGANKYKKIAFTVVKDVIEQGALIHEGTDENADSLYFSAPVVIDGNDNIVTVLVHRDVNIKRMYLHSVTTKENLLRQRVSRANAEASKRTSSTEEGGISNIVHDLIEFKSQNVSQAAAANGEPLVIEQDGRRVFKNTVTGETLEAEPALSEPDAPGSKVEPATGQVEEDGPDPLGTVEFWESLAKEADDEHFAMFDAIRRFARTDADGWTTDSHILAIAKKAAKYARDSKEFRATVKEYSSHSKVTDETFVQEGLYEAFDDHFFWTRDFLSQVIRDYAEQQAKKLRSKKSKITLDSTAISAADTFRLIAEGARLFAGLDENAPSFFADLGRLREILVALGEGVSDHPSAPVAQQPMPDEETLTDAGLLYEFNGRWKYASGGSWFTANSKEDAIKRASEAYWELKPEERLTRAQRIEKAEQEELAESRAKWGHLSPEQLEALHERMSGDLVDLRQAGRREFNGNGGRRTAPAVAAQGARDVAEEQRKLRRYIESMGEGVDVPATDNRKQFPEAAKLAKWAIDRAQKTHEYETELDGRRYKVVSREFFGNLGARLAKVREEFGLENYKTLLSEERRTLTMEVDGKNFSDRGHLRVVDIQYTPIDAEAAGATASENAESGAPEIVEHVTKKGKVIRGVIRRDLDRNSAKAIDPYTFRKDGGWFIREEHLSTAAEPETTEPSRSRDESASPVDPPAPPINTKHAVNKRDVLTPAGALSADARNSRANSAPWYYQGDIGQLSFTANVTIGGQPDPRAGVARDMLSKLKAASAQGWSRVSVRAGSLGTVWMLEKGAQFLTRSGFENMSNPVFERPDMPESKPGFTAMLERQMALARGFQAWLETLPEAQRQNRAVVVRKMRETPVGQWARLQDTAHGEPALSYFRADGERGIRIVQKDYLSLLAEIERLARGELSRYEQNALALERLEKMTMDAVFGSDVED